MDFKRLLAAALAGSCIAVAGCGGGGNSDSPPPTGQKPPDTPAAAPAELPSSLSMNAPAEAEVSTSTAFGSSLDNLPAGLSLKWDFGDGSSPSTATKPSHQFAKPGQYEVSLTVSNSAGESKTVTRGVTVSRRAMLAGDTCTGPGTNGWCWQRPKPTGNAILDIFFIDASTGWAVGEAGQVMKTTDGGANWAAQQSGVGAALTHVKFATPTTGWAVGDTLNLIRTTDGGATWTRQASGLDHGYGPSQVELTVVDESTALLSAPYSYDVRATQDGGNSWVTRTSSNVTTLVTKSGALWSLGYQSASVSADRGATWKVALQWSGDDYPQSIVFFDEQHGWISGSSLGVSNGIYQWTPVLWYTADGGASFARLTPTGLPSVGVYFQNMTFTSPSNGWLIGSQGGVYRSIDGGRSWAPAKQLSNAPGIGPITMSDSNTFWFPASTGVYLTRNAGASWKLMQVAAEGNSVPQLSVSAGAIWLRYGSRTYRSTDAGTSWQRIFGADAAESNSNLLGIWLFDGKAGLAQSSDGWLLDTADSGATWTRRSLTGTLQYPGRLQFNGDTQHGWALTSSTTISRSDDGGLSWSTPVSTSALNGLFDFHFVDAQHGWAVSNFGTIYQSKDGGWNWTSSFTDQGTSFSGVRFATASEGIAVGYAGVVMHTADGGGHWSLRATGTYQALTRATFSDAKTAWAVGNAGTLLNSSDGGMNWTVVAVPTSANLRDIAFADADHGWAVGESGTILATDNGGQSWALQPSGTTRSLTSLFVADSRTVWITGTDGNVLATATGGR